MYEMKQLDEYLFTNSKDQTDSVQKWRSVGGRLGCSGFLKLPHHHSRQRHYGFPFSVNYK